MLKIFCKSLLVSSAVVGVALTLSVANKAQAETATQDQNSTINQLDNYSNEGQVNSQDQITSVNELRDVAPTDWAYEALRSLVERYGCIVGYPDRTFRGNQALSRWEFAAGLNACLNTLERLIQENSVSKEDIEKLRRLAQEFQSELAALGAKVDNLEGRVSFLENHQFSTTTKLNGEVIFSIAGASQANNQVVFQDRVRLLFDTTFTGSDVLHTRLAAGNFANFNSNINVPGAGFSTTTVSPTTTLASAVGGGGGNSVSVDWLAYQAPIRLSKDMQLDTYIAAVNGAWYDFVPTINPYFQDYDGGGGSISAFSQENPIYRIGGGAGAGVSFKLGFLDSVIGPSSISLGYLAGPGANQPNQGSGLTNGSYGLLGQINANLFNVVNLGLTYVNGYADQGVPIFGMGGGGFGSALVGTQLANGELSLGNTNIDSRKVTNNYGIEAAVSPWKGISLSAFGTYTQVNFVGNPAAGTGYSGRGQVWTYGAGLAFADLGKEGSILGIFGGVQPYFGNVNVAGGPGTLQGYTTAAPYQIEAFYKYPVTDNISITPGVIWLNNPTQTLNSGNQWIGVLRGTFKF